MLLLSALDQDSLDLLSLDVKSLVQLSECSHAALQLASTSRLWAAALQELKRQHFRAGAVAEQAHGSPRVGLGLGMRRAFRDVLSLHRFFDWQCDHAPAFDMEASPEQVDEFGLQEQGDMVLELRVRNRSRYNLMNDIILLHMAEDDMRGAHSVNNERDTDDACHSFKHLLEASDEQVREVAASNRSEIALHPCGGSFFIGWWCDYVFGMFGTGEGAWARGPVEALVGVRIGSDAHLDFLLSKPPCFLTRAIWGDDAIAHLDVLQPARARLSALKERFPYSPSVAPRFLPFRFSSYVEFDAVLVDNPDWLANNAWATGAMTSDDDDDDEDDDES